MNKYELRAIAQEFYSVSLKTQKNLSHKRDIKKIFHSIKEFYSMVGLLPLWAYWGSVKKTLTQDLKLSGLSLEKQKEITNRVQDSIKDLENSFVEMNTKLREPAQVSVSFFLLILGINKLNGLDESEHAEFEFLDNNTQAHAEHFRFFVEETEEHLNKIIPHIKNILDLWDTYSVCASDPDGEPVSISFLDIVESFGYKMIEN